MFPTIKDLGKVSVTAEGKWNINKSYERVSLVINEDDGKTYISKKDVPEGINIMNEEYWQLVAECKHCEYISVNSKNFEKFEYDN